MKITALKQHLNGLSKEELVKYILDLYRKSNFVQSYLIANTTLKKMLQSWSSTRRSSSMNSFPLKEMERRDYR
jgi:hypothetical protein